MKTFKNFLFVLERFKTSSILNIAGLSIAFAIFIIILMQVDYDLSFDKCHKDYDHIYRVERVGDGSKLAILPRPAAEILFQSPHVVAGAIIGPFYMESSVTVTKNDTDEQIYKEMVLMVEPSFPKVIHFDMLEGSDAALEEPDKVLISRRIGQKFFGTESPVGKQIEVWGGARTIGGVYKDFPPNSSISNAIFMAMSPDENKNNWGNFSFCVFVHLDHAGAKQEIIEQFKAAIPEDILNKYWGGDGSLQFTPLADLHFTNDIMYDSTPKSSRATLMVLLAIAFAILAIAAINFNNFSMAQVPIRIRSINTQKVLGASTGSLRAGMISESVLMNLLGFALALIIVFLLKSTPVADLLDAKMSLSAHWKEVALTGGIALLVGLLTGLYPALYITSFQPALVLNGSFGLTPKGKNIRNALIGVQFVASLVLIISVSFMYMQNNYLKQAPVGYERDQVIITDLSNKINSQRDVFKQELKSFAGIEDVALSESLLGTADQYMGWGRTYRDKDIQYQVLPVEPAFLKVMNISVTEGRDFREDDKDGRFGKYIFNEKAHKAYELELNSHIDTSEIIGFMPDIQFTTFHTEPTPMAFFVWGTDNWGDKMRHVYIKVTAGSNMFAAMQHVKSTLNKLDPGYPFNVRFYSEALQSVYEKEQRLSSLIGVFSLIAILISVIGVFGLVIFETQYRRREISIRKIMGSSVSEVLQLFIGTYCFIVGVCFVIAVPVAYYFNSKWLDNFACKTPLHWWVFLLSGLFVLAIILMIVTTQSYKAATKNPTEAIH
ncbi:MAG: ABC transporter permease [Bacteroidales bacterium]|jgi:putative ABC transport system permease protein|nr:ABC transporter permease [Bacteroidales bacterium]